MRCRAVMLCMALSALCPSIAWPGEDDLSITFSTLDEAGRPLAGARVELGPVLDRYHLGLQALQPGHRASPVTEAVADRNGEVVIKAPGPGIWKIMVGAEQRLGVEHLLVPLLDDIDLGAVVLPGSVPTDVRVAHADGSAAQGVRVELDPIGEEQHPACTPGLRWRFARRSAWTDGAGAARLDRAWSELVEVAAVVLGGRVVEQVQDRSQVLLTLSPAVTARRAQLIDAQSAPMPGLLVSLGESGVPIGLTDDEGRVEIPGPAEAVAPWPVVATAEAGWSARLVEALESPDPAGAPEIMKWLVSEPPLIRGSVAGPSGPVAGAVVWLAADSGTWVRSDAFGRFRLPHSGMGRTTVQVAARGFFTERQSLERPAATAGSGQDGDGEPWQPFAQIQLTPASTIHGRTLGADGKPWAGVLLHLEAGSGAARRRWTTAVISSSPQGAFVIPYLVPGEPYILQASGVGLSTMTRRFEAPADTSRPGSIELMLGQGRSVIGRLVDSEQLPLAGAEVRLLPEDDGDDRVPAPVMSDEAGAFEASGVSVFAIYRLEISASDHAPLVIPRLAVHQGDGPLDLGILMLADGALLEGRVEGLDGEPLEGAEITAVVKSGSGSEPSGSDETDRWSIVTDSAGQFRFNELFHGSRVSIEARLEGRAFAQVDDIRVPSADPLVLVLVPGSRVSGRVVTADGGPPEEAVVELRVKEVAQSSVDTVRPPSHEPVVARVDEAGEFVIEDVLPGRLSLLGQARGYSPATLDGIVVEPGDEVSGLRLVLQPGASLEGSISSSSGQSVARAQVFVKVVPQTGAANQGNLAEPQHGSTVSDESGTFMLGELPAGAAVVEVEHPAFERARRELVLVGRERLEIVLRSGPEVSGRVTAEGSPIGGAEVTLVRSSGLPLTSCQSEADGAFRLDGARPGRYRLVASHEGYGPTTSEELIVDTAPLTGIELALTQAASVSGRLLGLRPEDLAEAEVMAGSSSLGIHQGVVNPDGSYRIDDLAAGEWRIGGWVQRSRLKAEERIVLDPGSGPVEIDLDFGTGRRLEGRVLLDGKALLAATVTAEGLDVTSSGEATTGTEGEFLIDGLVPGAFRLQVDQPELGLQHAESVEVPPGREVVIAITSATVTGLVVDARDEMPLAGVELSLVAADGAADPPTQHSDSSGRFSFSRVAAGWYRLAAEKRGFASQTLSLQVEPGSAQEEIRVSLEPTEGLRLLLTGSSGRPLHTAAIAVLSGQGQPIVSGAFTASSDGVFDLATVPAGRHRLLISAEGHALASTDVTVPGEEISLTLRPEARLKIEVPTLKGTSTVARVSILDPAGQPAPSLDWQGQPRFEHSMRSGTALIDRLPAMSCTVRVEGPDQSVWEADVRLAAGILQELVLS